MKFNTILALILGLLFAVCFAMKDLSSYRRAVNAADAAHTEPPDFDYSLFTQHVTAGLSAGIAAAATVSQLPGVAG